ncbi:hypothetical protein [Mycobacterium branderi]|uniref:hypothetical protein n=1 Tax=Mycobacterium branderi TaxID=43348 RepID=UPI0013D1C2AB|nr:hypothetical protein [Mycobacterium branderi]MCV7236015.1 hypothetical protein [Mycobacterium branderi]
MLRLSDHIRERLAPPVSVLWSAALDDRATLEAALLDFVTVFSSQYARSPP